MKKYKAEYIQSDGYDGLHLKFEAKNLTEAKKYAKEPKSVKAAVKAYKAFGDKLRAMKAAGIKTVVVEPENTPILPIVKIVVKEIKPIKTKRTPLYEF